VADQPGRHRWAGPDGAAPADDARPPVLEVENLTRVYGSGRTAVRALDDVTFSIAVGDMVCLMGKSGSGKSTLLHQLGLIDRPTSGRVVIDGVDVTGLRESRRSALRLERLGYVFQEYALLGELTAEENVFLPALMRGLPRAECRRRSERLLGMFGLAERARHRPAELSGGEQQRVAIARALVNDPAILFADEPTENLDTASTTQVMEALAQTNRDLGVTILFVSHDPDHRRYANRVVYLRDGAIVGPYL